MHKSIINPIQESIFMSKPIKIDLSGVWHKDFGKSSSSTNASTPSICPFVQTDVEHPKATDQSSTEQQPSESSSNLSSNLLSDKSTKSPPDQPSTEPESSITKVSSTKSTKKSTKEKPLLKLIYDETNCYEIGIDEAGRGPMFGRLYVAGVVLPKDGSFDHREIKDSKKFTSKKKIQEVYQYIKQHAIAYHVHYAEPEQIDKINIRQCVLNGMRTCAQQIIETLDKKETLVESSTSYKQKYFIMVDGDDFKPLTQFNEQTNTIEAIPHDTFVGGDHEYVAIAAASILAKVERDQYIAHLCTQYPVLVEHYGMDTHMGYGTKKHLDGIRAHGITQFHRRSYGQCKTAPLHMI